MNSSDARMALTATIYNLDIELADVDRGVYESLTLRVAREPSETAAYMLTRVLAYCLEYTEGIAFTGGVAAGDEPAVVVRDLTGRLTAWIEVGMPDAAASTGAARWPAASPSILTATRGSCWPSGRGRASTTCGTSRSSRSTAGWSRRPSSRLERRSTLSVSVTERELYLELDGWTCVLMMTEHRAS